MGLSPTLRFCQRTSARSRCSWAERMRECCTPAPRLICRLEVPRSTLSFQTVSLREISYVPRYFPALAEVAGRGDADLARVLCQHGFPHHAVDAATLRAGEQCLAGGGLTGSLARLAADQLADLRRSLQVRSLF